MQVLLLPFSRSRCQSPLMPRPEEAAEAEADSMEAEADFTVAVVDSMVAAVVGSTAVAADFMAADFAAAPHFTADVDFTLAAERAQVGVNSAPDLAGFGHFAAIDLSLCTIRQTGRSGAMRA
jgi:hypothetical protein